MYKRQGRIQHAIITHTYKTFLVREEQFQASVPTTLAVQTISQAFRPSNAVQRAV